MNRSAFRKKADKIYEEARDTLFRKNEDYAPPTDALANFRHGGFTSVGFRIAEKATRLKTIVSKGNSNYEQPRETLLDLLNFCLIGILMLDQKKRLSFPRKRS